MKTVDELDESEFTLPPLHQAARQRDLEKTKFLIASGANVNELDKRDLNGDGGNSPLWYAAQGAPAGGVAIAQLLIQAGAKVNAQGEFGMTPLHMACSWGHPDMVVFLHKHGADLDLKDDYGRTPASLARADYEEGKSTPTGTAPIGFETWLEGMASINDYLTLRGQDVIATFGRLFLSFWSCSKAA